MSDQTIEEELEKILLLPDAQEPDTSNKEEPKEKEQPDDDRRCKINKPNCGKPGFAKAAWKCAYGHSGKCWMCQHHYLQLIKGELVCTNCQKQGRSKVIAYPTSSEF